MSDEKKPAKSSESRNRRRYFRRKAGEKQAEPEASPVRARRATRAAGKSEAAPSGEARVRTASRRRRRNKGRRSGADTRAETVAAPIEVDENFALPASVFIYTHTIRPDSRESYEFRSEHFSKVGRTLEDYNIDVSSLFRQEESAASRIAAAFANMEFDDDEDEALASEPAPTAKRPNKERSK